MFLFGELLMFLNLVYPKANVFSVLPTKEVINGTFYLRMCFLSPCLHFYIVHFSTKFSTHASRDDL